MDTASIPMPSLQELNEELAAMHEEIKEIAEQGAELEFEVSLLNQIMQTLEAILAGKKDINQVNLKERISIMAHLDLFHKILDSIYGDDLDEDDIEEEEEEEDEE